MNDCPELSRVSEQKANQFGIFGDENCIELLKVLSNESIQLSEDDSNILSETPISKYLGDYGMTLSGLKQFLDLDWILTGSTLVHISQKMVGDLKWQKWNPQDIDFFKIVKSEDEIFDLKEKAQGMPSICLPNNNYTYPDCCTMYSFYVNLNSGPKLNFTIKYSESDPIKHLQEMFDVKICSASFSKKGFVFPTTSENASLDSMIKEGKLRSYVDPQVIENFKDSVQVAGLNPSGLKLTEYMQYQISNRVDFGGELAKKLKRIVKYQDRGIEILENQID